MIKLFRLCMVISLLLASAHICFAQFDFGGGDDSSTPPPPPWTQFHLNPNVRVKLDFRNASVDAVIQTLSQASGIPIVKDPSLIGGVTLQSPRPQTLDDAFAMFNAELDLKNADMTKDGNFLLIKVRQQTNGRFGGNYQGLGAALGAGGFGGRTATQTPVLQVYVLKYANATDLAKVINDVYATTSTANQTAGAGGFGGFGGAAAVTGGGGGGGGGFGGRRGGGVGALNGDNVHASADDFSNSLVINAPQRDQDEISDIIDQIDKPATQPQTAQVFHLTYALATDLLSTVQNILTNSTSLGRGGTSPTTQASRNTNQGGGGFFGRFGGGGSTSNNNANGSVSADVRTNSLVVSTTDQLMAQIQQVIAALDKPATYEGSTYLYVMKSARADVVTNLLNEALGNRETNGPTGGSLTTTGASQPTVTASSSSTSLTGSSPSLGSSTSTRTTSANTNTSSVTSSNSSLETQGLDEMNRIVNIRNLTGNVLLVPNVDTNSIIVTCPPEDWPILQSILQQMDEIPQQVMIDVLVVEVSLDKTDQFGIEYSLPANHGIFSQIFGLQSTYQSQTGTGIYTPSATNSVGLPTPGASTGLVYTLTSGQYSAFVQAAATDSKIDVLSTPRIFTTNNATAQINVSESVPYETGSTVSDGITQNSFDFLDVGLVLTVTPRVTSSGYVTMDVSQTANSIAAFLDNGTEPEVNQREAETTVSVMDGRTVCLGGIIQDTVNSTVNKVPLLSDIPLVGNLFRSTNRSNDKDELLVFLTPHVVSNPEDAQNVKDEAEAELGTEARSLIPKAPPAPKNVSAIPPTTTTVTVTPNVQTTAPATIDTTVTPMVMSPVPAPAATAPAAQAPAANPTAPTSMTPAPVAPDMPATPAAN